MKPAIHWCGKSSREFGVNPDVSGLILEFRVEQGVNYIL
jgi:hypothetical protein